MSDLLHRIKVYVYRYVSRQPRYLLVRGAQGIESFWSPLHAPLGFGEQLDSAIRRELDNGAGLGRPEQLIDLEMPTRWILGDEEVIEWQFGVRTSPREELIQLEPRWTDFRWADYAEAYPSLELDEDRAAITRLHTLLHAA